MTKIEMSPSGETPMKVPVDPADRLRADIACTRSEPGETVERLAAKLDVKTQAKRRLDEAAALARRYRRQLALAVAVTIVASAVLRRRR